MRLIRFCLWLSLLAVAPSTLLHAQEYTIWQAATNGDVDAIEAFIDAAADLDELSESGSAPLHYAVSINRVEVVALLLDAGADTDVEDSRQRTRWILPLPGTRRKSSTSCLRRAQASRPQRPRCTPSSGLETCSG